jgi:hypothetical protein
LVFWVIQTEPRGGRKNSRFIVNLCFPLEWLYNEPVIIRELRLAFGNDPVKSTGVWTL